MDIKIDQELMGKMIGASVMQSITTEQRDVLISAAVRHLLTPERTNFGPNESPLQKAFNQAVYSFALQFVRAELESEGSEFAGMVRTVIQEATTKALVDGRGDLVEKVAQAIAKGFEPKY